GRRVRRGGRVRRRAGWCVRRSSTAGGYTPQDLVAAMQRDLIPIGEVIAGAVEGVVVALVENAPIRLMDTDDDLAGLAIHGQRAAREADLQVGIGPALRWIECEDLPRYAGAPARQIRVPTFGHQR